ncbi:tetratricopeptide repeat protein, partial [Candidatus Woesearchaeota archaeon]|nr:tetratricopeptide repeat protein [Candidatus Woesearchaeota archaeon]
SLISLALINLALVLQKQGKILEAQETYQKMLEKNADEKTEKKSSSLSAEAHFGLGYCFFVQNNLEKAAQHFALAITHSPQFVEAYVNLAAVRERQEKLREAFALLQKSLTLAPQHARANYNKGVVLEKVGTFEALKGAKESYRKAAELGYAKKEDTLKRIEQIERFLEKEKTREK